MTLANLPDFSIFFSANFWVKIFLLTFIFFYCILSLVVLRQTQLMSKILDEVNFSRFLKLLAAIHFLAAVSLFISALILL